METLFQETEKILEAEEEKDDDVVRGDMTPF